MLHRIIVALIGPLVVGNGYKWLFDGKRLPTLVLGLLQSFLLPARKVLQQACRMGLPWDELISNAGIGIDDWDQ